MMMLSPIQLICTELINAIQSTTLVDYFWGIPLKPSGHASLIIPFSTGCC